MSIGQFLALSHVISRLEAEEEARALMIAHTGKPGDRVKELQKVIQPRHSRPALPKVDSEQLRPMETRTGELWDEWKRMKAQAEAEMAAHMEQKAST